MTHIQLKMVEDEGRYNHWIWVKNNSINYWSFMYRADSGGSKEKRDLKMDRSIKGEILPAAMITKPRCFNLDGKKIPDEIPIEVDDMKFL